MSGTSVAPELDVAACRSQFPALERVQAGQPVIYLDGPAGSQVPRRVVQAMGDYLLQHNANGGGLFATSQESDAALELAQAKAADLLGAGDPDEIIFGPNMTSLNFALSRALAQTWAPGDEVIVTRLDHDANVSPWVLAARDAGITVHKIGVRAADCTLDLDELRDKLNPRTRLVAVGCASNSVGTINPVREIIRCAHAAGAEVVLDAVHSTPHRLPDVTDWDCDYLLCSAYKFYGPHVGILWARRDRMEQLPAYKVRPAPNEIPGKWMTGTPNFEGIAGTAAAIDYLADLGAATLPATASRREQLRAAYDLIGQHEQQLARQLLTGLAELPSIRVQGITDLDRLEQRVPTFSITHQRLTPEELARHLAQQGIYTWHGHYYALELSEALGQEPQGMLRLGLMHYNTKEEVERLLGVLGELEINGVFLA